MPYWIGIGLVLMLGLGLSGPALADDDNWYDIAPEAYQLAPAPASTVPGPGGRAMPPNSYSVPMGYRQTPSVPLAPPSGKKWWQIWKAEKPAPPAPPVERIVNVGPREMPSSPDPLVRLGRMVRLGTKVAPAGIYLVRLVTPADGTASLSLARGGQVFLSVAANKLSPVATPQGPVEALPEKGNRHEEQVNRGPYRAVTVEPDAGGQGLCLLYQVGDSFYRSQPLTVVAN